MSCEACCELGGGGGAAELDAAKGSLRASPPYPEDDDDEFLAAAARMTLAEYDEGGAGGGATADGMEELLAPGVDAILLAPCAFCRNWRMRSSRFFLVASLRAWESTDEVRDNLATPVADTAIGEVALKSER